ncbi:MAG: hypothetical protein FJZ97_13295, partial [Chloroflexi bacterium]|nr:hypothetical protein [Chloroflexota bacterium]
MDTTLEQSLQKAKSVERQRETILPRLAELRELGKRLNGELTNLLTAQSIGEPVAQGKIDGLRRKLKDVEEE